MIIEVENNKYKLIEDVKEGFDKEEFLNKYTSFFEIYDYIVGDIAYSKLRLKGFTKKSNKAYNKLNDFNRLEEYIKENCAYGCKYFILEKIDDKEEK